MSLLGDTAAVTGGASDSTATAGPPADRPAALETVAEQGAPSGGRLGLRLRALGERRPAAVSAVVTAALSTGLFVLGFGGWLGRLAAPLGGGDLLPAYTAARLWSEGAPFGNSSFGFPFGMEQRYYPTADVLQNLVAGLVAWATDNPFLGINFVFALSFPVTALVGLWVFRVAGLRWTWAVFASLALTFLPYHWYRFPHIYLATMYSMVLGVGLALLVGNGTVERRLRSPGRWRFVAGLLLVAAVIGASGVYYACFTVLLCVTAILYRVLRGVRWRDAALSATPALAVTLALGAVLAPAMLYAWANPPLEPVAERDLAESVMYGGALVLALLPAPTSDIPGFGAVTDFSRDAVSSISGYPLSEVHSYSNFGCVATVAALLVFAVGGLVLARRSAVGAATGGGTFSTGREEPAVSLGLVSLLLATTLLFFVPWGLSYLFSYVVTTDLRGWNRLVPVLFTLLFVGAGLVLQRLGGRLRPVGAGIVAVVALLLLVFDSVLPYRGVFTGFTKEGRAFGDAGNAYAAALNEAVPGNCGVLQLPYVAYPEVPPRGNMGDYEQLWAALTNPGKSWSFGAMKGTEASAWQKSLGGYVEAEDIAPLKAAGFCAVHLDRRGYSAAEGDWTIARLSELLGPPVAAGLKNQWLAFALPSSGDTAVDADRLTQEPDGVGTFFAPPQWAPERGLASKPQETHPRTIWRLKSRTSELEATALPDGLPFSSISGELHAGECASNELTLTLRSGDDVQTRSIRLEAGEWTAFQMSLDEAHRNASFSVTRSGPRCEADADSGNGLSLVDLRAIG